jgi:hypothetical protein
MLAWRHAAKAQLNMQYAICIRFFCASSGFVPIHRKESKVDMVFSFGLGLGRLKHAYQISSKTGKFLFLLEQRETMPPGCASKISRVYTSWLLPLPLCLADVEDSAITNYQLPSRLKTEQYSLMEDA